MPNPHPGQWQLVLNQSGCELNTQNTAVHACIVYNQSTQRWEVLYFLGDRRSFLWDPENPTAINELPLVPLWPETPEIIPNFFCSGHSFLADGRLLVAGGLKAAPEYGLRYTYIFDPIEEEWNVASGPTGPHAMAGGRYYPTLTTLGEDPGYGKILAMSGNLDDELLPNKDPEIYDPNTGWNLMQNPPQARQPFDDLYPSAHLIAYGGYAGKLFYSLPMKQAWRFNPYFPGGPLPNGGYWDPVGQQRTQERYRGNSVLLPLLPNSTSQKILILGGSQTEFTAATNTAEIIDLSNPSPQWSQANPLAYARRNADAVILPNDTILVVGGNQLGQNEATIFTAELYDVETGLWSVLPPQKRRRAYHSTALLLPDGRVWVGGTIFLLVVNDLPFSGEGKQH
jgi:hypothetical protein